MIQKYLKIQAPPQVLLDELGQYDSWMQWYPGLERIKVLEDGANRSVINLVINSVKRVEMTLEVKRKGNLIKQKQLEGWFKSYASDWILMEAPGQGGTTLKITVKLDSGMLVPKTMVYSKLSESFSELEKALNKRLKDVPVAASPARDDEPAVAESQAEQETGGDLPGRVSAHILPLDEKGLEIWLSGKRHVLTMQT